MSRKISPELEEHIRRTNEQGRAARAYMQALIDRHDARRRAEAERIDRRRDRRLRLRRILTLGLG
jgi:hypothetical protein